MTTRIQVEGLEEVTQKLRRLGDKRKAKNITRKAARRAMNVVRDAARENARAIDDPETKARIYKKSSRSQGVLMVAMML